MQRFAASSGAVNAYAPYLTFNPTTDVMMPTMQANALERISTMDANSNILKTQNLGEARETIGELQGQMYKDSTPGMGETILGGAIGGLSASAGGLGKKFFGSGQDPLNVVNSFGNQASGLPGNDFYVSGGSIFPNPV